MKAIFAYILFAISVGIICWYYWPLIVAMVLMLFSGYIFIQTEAYKNFKGRKKQ